MFTKSSIIGSPTTVNYMMWAGSRLDQLTESSCTGATVVNACDAIALRLGIKVDLSMQYNYDMSRSLGGIVGDNGSQIPLALKAAMNGIASTATCPFDPQNVNTMPSAAAVANSADFKVLSYEEIYLNPDNLIDGGRAIKGALAQGYIPLLATDVNREFMFEHRTLDQQVWINPTVTNPMATVGRHALTLEAYGTPGTMGSIIAENSWNTTWGDNGFGIIGNLTYADKAYIITAVQIKGVTYDFTYTNAKIEVAELYSALFDRSADATGLNYWNSKIAAGESYARVAQDMYNVDAAREMYPTNISNSDTITSFYSHVLGRNADAQGLAYWANKLTIETKGQVVCDMIDAVTHYTGSDTAALASQALFNNKANVGMYYAVQMAGTDISQADYANDHVTADVNSVEIVKIGLADHLGYHV